MRGTRGGAVAIALALLARGAASAPEEPPSIRGTVRDFAGKPVPHVIVQCGGEFAADPGYRVAEVATDGEGRYEVRGLGRGETFVSLLAESGVGTWERTFEWNAFAVVDFTVHGECEVEGRLATAEAGPFDVELVLRQELGGLGWHDVAARRARVGADGAFRLPALRVGVYDLRVLEAGVERTTREVDVLESVRGLEVPLPALPRGALRARVVSRWATEPSNVVVQLWPEGGHSTGRTAVPSERVRPSVTSAVWSHTFAFDRLAAGPWWAEVRVVLGESVVNAVDERRWFRVTVGDGPQEATFDCGPAEDVRVAIVPPAGRPSISGRVVLVEGPFEYSTPFATRRGPDGTAVIWEAPDGVPGTPPGLRREPVPAAALPIRNVAKGTRRIRVEALGCEPAEKTVDVSGPTRVEFRLAARPGRVVVLPEDETTATRAHVRVEARRDEPGAPWSEVLWTRAWPRASHGPVPGVRRAFLAQGTWRFRATSAEHDDAALGPVEVEADGPPLPLAFTWTRGVAVSGRVTLHGLYVDDGWVYPWRLEADGTWRALAAKEVFVDEGGTYRVTGLSPGRYRFAGTSRGRPVLGESEVGAKDLYLDLAWPSAQPARPR